MAAYVSCVPNCGEALEWLKQDLGDLKDTGECDVIVELSSTSYKTAWQHTLFMIPEIIRNDGSQALACLGIFVRAKLVNGNTDYSRRENYKYVIESFMPRTAGSQEMWFPVQYPLRHHLDKDDVPPAQKDKNDVTQCDDPATWLANAFQYVTKGHATEYRVKNCIVKTTWAWKMWEFSIASEGNFETDPITVRATHSSKPEYYRIRSVTPAATPVDNEMLKPLIL